jgi:hypothetical protein
MKLFTLLRYSPGAIRFRLLRDLLSVLVLTVAALVLAIYLLGAEMRRELAWSRITQAQTLVREEMRRLVEPLERQLNIARDWIRSGELALTDPAELNLRFIPTLAHLEQVSGLAIAGDDGAEYFLLRGDGEWLTRLRPPGASGQVQWSRWSAAGERLAGWDEDSGYDPRERPWYQGAIAGMAEQRISWSQPYLFHSRQVPGITASLAWPGETGVRVLALDLELSRVVQAMEQLPIAAGEEAFLFRDDGGVFLPPGLADSDDEQRQQASFVAATARLGSPLAFDGVHAWLGRGKPAAEAVAFDSGGRRWWGGFTPLHAGAESTWIGVAVPAQSLWGVLRHHWIAFSASLLGLLLLGGVMALLLVRKYSRQLKDLPKLSIDPRDAESDLYQLLHAGENAHLEFKSTMRRNLKSGKHGKEIELAWLKGVAAFLNTDGGILLLGVADDAEVLGLGPDEFDNEDKCRLHFKNLFNQHIGPEYSRFVRFELFELEGRQIAAVECERASEPAFLHDRNTEAFYIRSGPSNIELSVSRALKYLRGRF